MADYPRWDICWSTSNWSSFCTWMEHYASEEDKQNCIQLHIVNHKQKTNPDLDAMGLKPEKIPQTFVVNGERVTFPERLCQTPNCKRCLTGRGGWQFRWIDRRWTPEESLNLSLNPLEHHEAVSQPWPMGMLMPPKTS